MNNPFKFRGIRQRFTFWFLIISILPLITAIFIIEMKEERSLRKEMFNKLEAVRNLKAREINNWIDHIKVHIKTISTDPETLSLKPGIHRLKLENIRNDIPEIESARNLLKRHMPHISSLKELYLVCNHTGRVLVSSDRQREGSNCSGNICGPLVRGMDRMHVSDIYYSEADKKEYMAVTAPVYDPGDNGSIMAVLVGITDIDKIMDEILMSREGIGDSGEMLIVNSEGTALSNLRWHNDAPMKLKIKARPAVEASSGNTGVIEGEDYRGEPVLSAYTYIPEPRWGFVVMQDLKELRAHIIELRMWMAAVGIGTIMLVMIPAFRISRSITGPVRALVEETEKVGKGDLSHKVGTDDRDEIGELSRRFDKMTEQLSAVTASRDELNAEIAERKKAEAFVKNVLETVNEGFIIVDREYRILAANRAFCEQVKMSAAEVVGKQCFEVSHHIGRPCYETGEKCSVNMTFETGRAYDVIHTHYNSEGAPVYIETRSYPIKDASGEINSVIETTVNITERVKLEEQVRHSQKMKTVGQLAGGIAHDFNNILSAIVSYGHILLMKMEDNNQRATVQKILDSADRASNLTKNLLAFSRKQKINRRPLGLNELVKNIEHMIMVIVGDNIKVKTVLTEEELTVLADGGQLDQVILNLVTNARDAMPNGGELLIKTETVNIDNDFIRTHGYGETGRYAVLTIIDTGVGMDSTTSEKIFEPFFTTKEVGEGTGLGLAMAYGITKQHKGYINVYSNSGEGATFRIYLPLAINDRIQQGDAG